MYGSTLVVATSAVRNVDPGCCATTTARAKPPAQPPRSLATWASQRNRYSRKRSGERRLLSCFTAHAPDVLQSHYAWCWPTDPTRVFSWEDRGVRIVPLYTLTVRRLLSCPIRCGDIG